MPKKLTFIFVMASFLLTMCRNYSAEPVVSANGLSCQNFVDVNMLSRTPGAECFFVCVDGSVRQPELKEEFLPSSSLYNASHAQVETEFCGDALQAVPTRTPAVIGGPTAVLPTPTATVIVASPTALPSPTVIPTLEPLLTGEVSMCNQSSKLINLRIVSPTPDMKGKAITAKIGDFDTTCKVNDVNPSLLSCGLPAVVVFPVNVTVKVDDAIVNQFVYDGVGCSK